MEERLADLRRHLPHQEGQHISVRDKSLDTPHVSCGLFSTEVTAESGGPTCNCRLVLLCSYPSRKYDGHWDIGKRESSHSVAVTQDPLCAKRKGVSGAKGVCVDGLQDTLAAMVLQDAAALLRCQADARDPVVCDEPRCAMHASRSLHESLHALHLSACQHAVVFQVARCLPSMADALDVVRTFSDTYCSAVACSSEFLDAFLQPGDPLSCRGCAATGARTHDLPAVHSHFVVVDSVPCGETPRVANNACTKVYERFFRASEACGIRESDHARDLLTEQALFIQLFEPVSKCTGWGVAVLSSKVAIEPVGVLCAEHRRIVHDTILGQALDALHSSV
eukprot:gene1068-638_t